MTHQSFDARLRRLEQLFAVPVAEKFDCTGAKDALLSKLHIHVDDMGEIDQELLYSLKSVIQEKIRQCEDLYNIRLVSRNSDNGDD